MRTDESRPDLDAVIDEVARAMTAGEPGTALRLRVAERIRAGRCPWRRPVWPWAAAAAALILAAAVPWSRAGRTSAPVLAPDAVVTRAETAPVAAPKPGPVGQEPRRMEARVQVLQAARVSPPAEPAAMGPAPIEPPALTVEWLLVESLEADRVVLEAIAGPTPLDIERLEVEPLPTYRVE